MRVLYHTDKSNVVEDAESKFSMESLSHVEESKINLVKDVHRLDHLRVKIEGSPNGSVVVHHKSKSTLVVEMNSMQHLDPLLMELKYLVLAKMSESFSQGGVWCSYVSRKILCA